MSLFVFVSVGNVFVFETDMKSCKLLICTTLGEAYFWSFVTIPYILFCLLDSCKHNMWVHMYRQLTQLTYLGAGENNLTSLPREIGQSFLLLI